MILYKEDWAKYPEAIPDYQTGNKSFLRLAGIYKSMGIDNCEYMLALHDRELVGIDPRSEKLTFDQILRISTEVKINPWYFFREVVRLPATAGPDAVPLQGNRGNIALYWLFFNHITSLLIQPRQTGKSVSTDCLMVYLFGIATVSTDISLLTKDDTLRVKNVARVKNILEELPFYLRFKSSKDTYNTEKLSLTKLNNNYITNVAQASEKAALNIGRGMTNAINQIDEIAFISNIHKTLPALLAASGAARDNAEAAGAYYGNIFTTTAGFLSSESGKFAKGVYDSCLRWTEKLFDCKDNKDLRKTIVKNNPAKHDRVLLEFNHRQLGYTDEWLRGKISDAMSSGEDAGADFLNLWAEGSESSAIPKNILAVIKASLINEPYTEISRYGYITRWYMREMEVKNNLNNRKAVMCLDTSDAVGSDDIALVIRDISTGETLGAGTYNETNLITFSEFVCDMLVRYPNLTLIIERKSSGVAIIDNLLRLLPAMGIDPFARIFNWVVNDSDTNENYFRDVVARPTYRRDPSIYVKYRKQFGYATSGAGRSSRDNLYGMSLMASSKYTASTVRDAVLVNQLAGLIKKNGRIDHSYGSHDDMVVSWLLGYWFLLEAKNKEFYGIPKNQVLTAVTAAMIDEEGGQDMIIARNKQLRIKTEIEALVEAIKIEKNSYKIIDLTNRLRFRFRDVDTKIMPNFNIDSLIDSINLEKRKNNNSNTYYAAA